VREHKRGGSGNGGRGGGGVFGVHANPGGRYDMQFSQ